MATAISAIPSLATAQQAGLLTAGYTGAGVNTAGYTTAAGAQANLTNAEGQTGTAQTAAGAQANTVASQQALADAQTRELDQNELVSNQLNNILGEDSQLLQRTRALAAEQANKRGLLNSSIAAQAGTAAMIDTATPIAQGNASAYSNVADRNLANKQQLIKVIPKMQKQSSILITSG